MLSSSCRLVARSCAATSSPSSRARCSCSDLYRARRRRVRLRHRRRRDLVMSRRSRRASSATRCACSSAVSRASAPPPPPPPTLSAAGARWASPALDRPAADGCASTRRAASSDDGRSIGWRGGSFHDLTVDAAPKTVFDASRGSMIGAIFGVDDALWHVAQMRLVGARTALMSDTHYVRPRGNGVGRCKFWHVPAEGGGRSEAARRRGVGARGGAARRSVGHALTARSAAARAFAVHLLSRTSLARRLLVRGLANCHGAHLHRPARRRSRRRRKFPSRFAPADVSSFALVRRADPPGRAALDALNSNLSGISVVGGSPSSSTPPRPSLRSFSPDGVREVVGFARAKSSSVWPRSRSASSTGARRLQTRRRRLQGGANVRPRAVALLALQVDVDAEAQLVLAITLTSSLYAATWRFGAAALSASARSCRNYICRRPYSREPMHAHGGGERRATSARAGLAVARRRPLLLHARTMAPPPRARAPAAAAAAAAAAARARAGPRSALQRLAVPARPRRRRTLIHQVVFSPSGARKYAPDAPLSNDDVAFKYAVPDDSRRTARHARRRRRPKIAAARR